MVVVRFAPAPSGPLHLGNIRTALFNWLFARKHGGRFVLRLDNTDALRCHPADEKTIQEDLLWLGLSWNDFMRQSDMCYADTIDTLKKTGRLYPCYESTEELKAFREQCSAQGRPPVYRRKGHDQTEKKGQTAHWRFALEEKEVPWEDMMRGSVSYHTKHLSDPILLRENGEMSYMLSSVADDIRLQISHIIRGEDHVTNTAIQIQLFEALSAACPLFGHFPLLQDTQGKKLSKRLKAMSVKELRDQGILPMAVLNVLISLGSGKAPPVDQSLDDSARTFSLTDYGRAPPCLDRQQIVQTNQALLKALSYQQMCQESSSPYPSPELWDVIRDNITFLKEITFWMHVCAGSLTTSARKEDHSLLAVALKYLPLPPWGPDSWQGWMRAIQDNSPYQGKSLYHPLRFALTG